MMSSDKSLEHLIKSLMMQKSDNIALKILIVGFIIFREYYGFGCAAAAAVSAAARQRLYRP